jgi:hypothetical protein
LELILVYRHYFYLYNKDGYFDLIKINLFLNILIFDPNGILKFFAHNILFFNSQTNIDNLNYQIHR